MASNYRSFKQVVELFETACDTNLVVNTFKYGTIDKLDSSLQNVEYPYVFLRPMSSAGLQQDANGVSAGTRQLQFELYSLDIPKLTESDYLGVMGDTEQTIYDLISYFNLGDYQQETFVNLVNITPVNEAFNDRVYGWTALITYNEEGVYNYCDYPKQ